MSGRVFLDSNILVYAYDTVSVEKQRRSREIIARLADSGDGVISTQAMQEFFVSVTSITLRLAVEAMKISLSRRGCAPRSNDGHLAQTS